MSHRLEELLSTVIERVDRPGIPVKYALDKLRQARTRRIEPSHTDLPDSLVKLCSQGIVVVPGFASRDEVGTIVDEIGDRSSLLGDRSDPAISKRNARHLLLEPERRFPLANQVFFENPRVAALCRAYLGGAAIPSRPAVQLKCDVGESSVVDFFHIDEWRYLVSAFLLLEDVGPDQAPMVYLAGSHLARPWRIPREKDFYYYYNKDASGAYTNEESRYSGCVLPTDARRIRERYGYREVCCTGSAGSLLVFDNLGLHRSTPLRSGRRLILSTYWTIP